jgi:hypothetical protein
LSQQGRSRIGIFFLAIVFAGVILGWFLYKKRQRAAPLSADSTIRFHGGGKYEFAVVGVSRYRPALEKIYGDDHREVEGKQVDAVLVLEENNSHDKSAVRLDIQGQTVGYLSGDLAREYRRRLSEGVYLKVRGICKAKITSRMYRSLGADFNVRLDLPAKRASAATARVACE